MKQITAAIAVLCATLLMLGGCGKAEVPRAPLGGGETGSVSAGAAAKDSSHMEHWSVDSRSLGKTMKVNVYVPKSYSGSEPYPVLYVLHGKNGNENSFFANGLDIGRKMDKLAAAGKIKPMLIVSPQLDNSYGVNSADQVQEKKEYRLGRYEDYVMQDLIPAIDADYNTVKSREGRFIGGISMGGYAALHLAFVYPDKFSRVGGHSAAVWKETPSYLAWLYEGGISQDEVDPVRLAAKGNADRLQIYLDHGQSEHAAIAEGNDALKAVLDRQGVPYQFHTGQGGHNNKYWAAHIEDYLLFYGADGK
ncbi:alpha/beta hydrolase [Paenibacillus sp. NPDC058071]|uniref:alpha/beta hydrolase n=1 Tax=Paenibacillus sp. NPDC058071 TaxID=3346326 RepID=UPI0036DCD3F5